MSKFNSPLIVSKAPADLGVPGVAVEFEAAEAERLGAFEEDAITEADVEGSPEKPA